MSADHSNTITVNIFLAPLPPTRAGFGTALFIVDQDDGNTLGGDRIVSFANSAEAEAAEIAGTISADTLAALQTAFSQQPTPSKVKVAYHDSGAAESVTTMLAAIEAVDADWYGVAFYSRVAASIVAMSAAIETRKKIYVAQSQHASWLTGTLDASLTDLEENERTAVIVHDDEDPADLAWLVSRLVFNPDERSAGWEGQIRQVDAQDTLPTTAQRDFVMNTNSANIGLPFSSAAVYVSPGQNMNGRAIYEILSGDWLAARIAEDVAYLKLQHTARGEKIIVDATGQAKIMTILAGRLQQGEEAGHFVKGQTRATAETISADDISNRRLRFKAEAQIAADARLFVFNVYLQPDPLQAE